MSKDSWMEKPIDLDDLKSRLSMAVYYAMKGLSGASNVSLADLRKRTGQVTEGALREAMPGLAFLEEKHFVMLDREQVFKEQVFKKRADCVSFTKRHAPKLRAIADEFQVKLDGEHEAEILGASWCDYAGKLELWEKYKITLAHLKGFRGHVNQQKRHYMGLEKVLSADHYLPEQPRDKLMRQVQVIQGVLDAFAQAPGYDPKQAERWGREKLGLNMSNAIMRKQEFWNDVVMRLVDVVHPLLKVKTGGRAHLWTRTYDFTARLLHACYPDVWLEDFKKGAKLVKNRHYQTF